MIVIELEGEPRGWARVDARVVIPKNGKKPFVHFYQDAKTRAFEEALKWKARAAMKGRKPLAGAICVTVFAIMGVPKSWPRKDRDAALTGAMRPTGKPDWDNFAKMLDALNEVVWDDDAQVVDGGVHKFYSEFPRLRVEIAEADPFFSPQFRG